RMQNLINEHAGNSQTMGQLFDRLERHGVSAIPNIASTWRVTGISFRLGNEVMKGSDLGRSFSWQGLQKRGITYEHDRDFQRVRQSFEREKLGGPGKTRDRTAPHEPLGTGRLSGSAGAL